MAFVGLSYSYNGFIVEDVKLYNKEKENVWNTNKIKIGRTMYVNIEGITKFNTNSGSIHPGCEITISDDEDNVVVQIDDFYADKPDFHYHTDTFSIPITFQDPIVAGKEYKTFLRFYDKKKPSHELKITIKNEVVK